MKKLAQPCPPITREDLAEATKYIKVSRMEKAQYLEEVGALAIAHDLSKVVQLLDHSKIVRIAAGPEAADAMLDQARGLLLSLMGIE